MSMTRSEWATERPGDAPEGRDDAGASRVADVGDGVDADVVVISSSPLCLVEAVARARQGARVIVLDARDRLGGAWDVTTLAGYEDVESCAHLLTSHPKCFDFLSREIGLDLAPLDPAPVSYSWGLPWKPRASRYETFGWKIEETLSRLLVRGLPRSIGQWNRAMIRPLGRAVMIAVDHLRGRRPQHLYPKGGTAEMIRRLGALIGAEPRIEVRLETRADACRVDEARGIVTVETDRGPIRARHAVITNQTWLREIETPRERLGPTGTREACHQLLLHVEDPTPIRCSYVEFNGHPLIRRFSDVTAFTRDHDPAVRTGKILAVTTTRAIEDEADDRVVLDEIIAMKLVDPGARITHRRAFAHGMLAVDRGLVVALQRRYAGFFTQLWTADFAECVAAQADRWTAMLKAPAALAGERPRLAVAGRIEPAVERRAAA